MRLHVVLHRGMRDDIDARVTGVSVPLTTLGTSSSSLGLGRFPALRRVAAMLPGHKPWDPNSTQHSTSTHGHRCSPRVGVLHRPPGWSA